MTIDIGLTHIAFAVADVEASVAFYGRYASMKVVHDRPADHGASRVVWISDLTRPFVLVLVPTTTPEEPLGPLGHLGFGAPSRADVDRLAATAEDEGRLVLGPVDSGPPVGYWCLVTDPDGNTVEFAFGQEVGLAVFDATGASSPPPVQASSSRAAPA